MEELFTRIATTAFESVMMKEIEASLVPSNGQIARTSTLISTLLNRYLWPDLQKGTRSLTFQYLMIFKLSYFHSH